MVELRPSDLKLTGSLKDQFSAAMSGMRYRPIDLVQSRDQQSWVNSEKSVTFELRSPDIRELAMLTCNLSRLKPTEIDYMHALGDHCLVYWLKWSDK